MKSGLHCSFLQLPRRIWYKEPLVTPAMMSRRSTAESGSRVHRDPGEPGGDAVVSAGWYIEAWAPISKCRSCTMRCISGAGTITALSADDECPDSDCGRDRSRTPLTARGRSHAHVMAHSRVVWSCSAIRSSLAPHQGSSPDWPCARGRRLREYDRRQWAANIDPYAISHGDAGPLHGLAHRLQPHQHQVSGWQAFRG